MQRVASINYLEGQLIAANFDVKVYEYIDVKDQFAAKVHSLDTIHSYETTRKQGLPFLSIMR